MKYTTTIKAIDPKTGELKEWMGPVIDAISFKHAKRYCNENGLGYCKVIGELIAEIPADGLTPDMDNIIDYETIKMN